VRRLLGRNGKKAAQVLCFSAVGTLIAVVSENFGPSICAVSAPSYNQTGLFFLILIH
jgi:hypothetical protein